MKNSFVLDHSRTFLVNKKTQLRNSSNHPPRRLLNYPFFKFSHSLRKLTVYIMRNEESHVQICDLTCTNLRLRLFQIDCRVMPVTNEKIFHLRLAIILLSNLRLLLLIKISECNPILFSNILINPNGTDRIYFHNLFPEEFNYLPIFILKSRISISSPFSLNYHSFQYNKNQNILNQDISNRIGFHQI